MHTTQDFMQSFSPPKAYLEAAKDMEGRLLPEGSNEAVSMKVTLDAIRRVLYDAQEYGLQRFKAGFESGRQQILSCLSPGIQAEILGAIDLDTMKAFKEMDEGKPVHLICKRCGTKWFNHTATSARCPMCDMSDRSEERSED